MINDVRRPTPGRAAVAIRDAIELPAADAHLEMQERPARYAN